MPTASILDWTGTKLEPYMRPDLAVLLPINLPASINYAQGTVLGEKIGTDEVTSLTMGGGPTGGDFTITYGGQTTAAIAYNAGADAIRDALEALSSVGDGNVRVTGGPINASPVYVEWTGALADANVTAPTVTNTGLTGGTSPAVVVGTTTGGAAGTAGVYAAYDNDNTDGSNVPRCILPYAVQTTSAGLIVMSSTSGMTGGEFGQTQKSVDAYFAGYFRTTELTGLDTRALQNPGWRLISGTVADGILAVGM